MDPVDNAIRRHYAQHDLDVALVARTAAAGKRIRNRRLAGATTLAAVLFFAGGVAFQEFQEYRQAAPDQVLAEMVANHLKQERIEVAANSAAEVGRLLPRLGVSLSEPGRFGITSAVFGGRYCSIDGRIAAQVRLAGSQQKPETLFAARMDSRLEKLRHKDSQIGNMRIRTWEADGVFWAHIAETPAATQ